MAYAAKKHEEGKNAYNPFGGMMTPHESEGPGATRWSYGRMSSKKKGKKKSKGKEKKSSAMIVADEWGRQMAKTSHLSEIASAGESMLVKFAARADYEELTGLEKLAFIGAINHEEKTASPTAIMSAVKTLAGGAKAAAPAAGGMMSKLKGAVSGIGGFGKGAVKNVQHAYKQGGGKAAWGMAKDVGKEGLKGAGQWAGKNPLAAGVMGAGALGAAGLGGAALS
jgi:hypothetical protein